jgi:2-dehydro-3-deoxyphosphogalactonate aldolase
LPTLDELLAAGAPPVVAILRGLKPDEALAIGGALLQAGVRAIEVPLNSPDPFTSIALLAAEFGSEALIGAGTVLDRATVANLAEAGGRLLVAPNCNLEVIAAGIAAGMDVMPGVMTPTEALAATDAGARRLKLFPAGPLGPAMLGALRDVLPSTSRIWAVGGVGTANAATWLAAGAEGLGVGGSLYRPGAGADDVRAMARELLAAVAAR